MAGTIRKVSIESADVGGNPRMSADIPGVKLAPLDQKKGEPL
jgi:hypothetical protein